MSKQGYNLLVKCKMFANAFLDQTCGSAGRFSMQLCKVLACVHVQPELFQPLLYMYISMDQKYIKVSLIQIGILYFPDPPILLDFIDAIHQVKSAILAVRRNQVTH